MSVGSQNILIVDDERLVADTLRTIFSNHGYEARSFYSAEAALDALANWKADLAILDVQLPSMNGIELALRLKDQLPSCHVLLFSGQASTSELLERAASEGHVLKIMAKPLHPTELLNYALHLLRPEQPS